MVKSKLAYFQGGGGVNEPTPGKKKYKSDPAIVVQPRFKEPFYHNYDLYTVPGMENVGPGTGYHGLQNYKSVAEFLKARRERLKPRYVSDDSWQIDSGKRVKKNSNIEARALIFEQIIKTAGPNYDLGKGLYQEMSDGKVDSVQEFREEGNHGPDALMNFKKKDVNNIDFPIDDMIGSDPIVGNSGSSYIDSIPIADDEGYTPDPDLDGKPESSLNFGYDLSDEAPLGRQYESYDQEEMQKDKKHKDIDLEELEEKYLQPTETGLFGLPDGVDPEGHDASETVQSENPDYGISDSGRQMYEDKWNI